MTYKVSEEGNVSTVFLNGEIDMDVTEKAKEVILPNFEDDYSYLNGVGKEYSCLIHAYFLNYPGYELGMKKK